MFDYTVLFRFRITTEAPLNSSSNAPIIREEATGVVIHTR